MVQCAVMGCSSNNDRKSKNFSVCRFFSFPKNKQVREVWVQRCYRKFKFNVEMARICSKHYSVDDYCLKEKLLNLPETKWKLKPDAVPSINLMKTPTAQSIAQKRDSLNDISNAQHEHEVLNKESIIGNEAEEESFLESLEKSRNIATQSNSEHEVLNNESIIGNEAEEESFLEILGVDTMFDSTNIESSILTKDFNKLCRTCLCENKLINIFKSSENKEPKITDLLKELLQLEDINNDNLPQNICTACFQDIHRFFAFKQKCKQNEKALQNVLKVICEEKYNAEAKIEPEDIIEEIKTFEDANCSEDPYFSDEDSKPTLPEKTCKAKRRKILTNPFKFKCRQCFEGFNTMPELKQHKIKNKHTQIGNLKCKVCNKTVTKLNVHMRVHTKEKPYKCEVCQQGFSQSNSLRWHNMIHTGERPFQCKICGKGFIRSAALDSHVKIHPAKSSENDQKLDCNICGKSFKRITPYNHHLKRHILENGGNKVLEDSEEEVKAHTCNICNKAFKNKYSHKLTHGEKTFLCSDCGKGFVTKAALQSHTKTHTGEKPHTCAVCKKSFSQVAGFDAHMLIHTGHKLHKCEFCSKTFRLKPQLTYHLRTHSGERPYSCSFCGKTFAGNGNLKVHLRIHTGETPYLCSVCGKGFYDSSSRKKHQRSHSAAEGSKVIIYTEI